MEMYIALTNLGKYNEGELVYTRLALPFTDEELAEAKKEIGIDGVNYEEWFITDYEAPFEIGEYDNLDRINEIAEVLNELPTLEKIYDGTYDVEDVLSFASEAESKGYINDAHYHVGDIIDDETLNEMVRGMVENNDDWTRIRYFLHDANATADWHRLDGYGNVDHLTHDYLENIVDDLMRELKTKIDEE